MGSYSNKEEMERQNIVFKVSSGALPRSISPHFPIVWEKGRIVL